MMPLNWRRMLHVNNYQILSPICNASAAQDHQAPAYLATLMAHQLAHMNNVIGTMIAFLGGADTQTLNQGIADAGTEHDLYTLEIARLLGITLAPVTSVPIPASTAIP